MSDVDDYLAAVPEPQRATLQVVRERLRGLLPDAQEAVYYGVPAFKIDGKGIAGYSSAKKHCSYFPMSGTVLEHLADQLEGLDWSKGTLRFPIDTPLSQELLSKLVEARRLEVASGKAT